MLRILRIPGRSAAARRARLAAVRAWMERHGWQLGDWSEEAGSALFERPADAPVLGPLHATRWLPGPRALAPGNWWSTLRADPRLAVLPGTAGAVALLLGLALFGPSSFDAARLREEAARANWYRVTSSQLNVREGPGTQHPIVAVLYHDQRVLVEAEVDASWVKLSVPERGYVSREFLAQAPPLDGDRGDGDRGDGDAGADGEQAAAAAAPAADGKAPEHRKAAVADEPAAARTAAAGGNTPAAAAHAAAAPAMPATPAAPAGPAAPVATPAPAARAVERPVARTPAVTPPPPAALAAPPAPAAAPPAAAPPLPPPVLAPPDLTPPVLATPAAPTVRPP